MALILRYRLDPPEEINQVVYERLAEQVGEVGINVSVPLNEDGSSTANLVGTFISVEGEHSETAQKEA